MSTSVKNLTPIQTLFMRPTFVLGLVVIALIVIAKPTYNLVPAVAAIPLYWILYQSRRAIYKLGLGRFDLLACLFYVPFVVSAFINWQYQDGNILLQLKQIHWWELFTDGAYQDQIKAWFIANADSLIHWKMLIFTPSVTVVLYLLLVEFDRKTVKDNDLKVLGLTDSDLFRRSGIFDVIGMLVFIFCCALYGWQFAAVACIFIGIMVFLPANWYAVLALVASVGILVLNYAHFDYVYFLSIPRQFITIVGRDGVWDAIKGLIIFGFKNNIGQWYILVPYLVFSGIIALKFVRNRAQFEEVEKEREQQREIATTADAIDFGYEIVSRKPVRLTHKELNTHMYINGASGSGKTVAMLSFVDEAAKKALPLIYIDGKGATDLEDTIAKIAYKNGRKFRVFTLSPDAIPEASSYDFLGAGTFTEKKNRIMQLFISADAAGAAYYQDNLETFINRVFLVIKQNKMEIDLFKFLTLISNCNDLIALATEDVELEDGSRINLKSYFEEIKGMKPEQSPRTRIITKLDPFIHSSYGHLFNVTNKANVINLKESILNGEIVLFLFDASTFSLDTERVAKMVISDINATFAEFGKTKKPLKTFCCFDEFKSYQTDAIAKTISLHRSNGMHAIIGTQSLALIDKEIGDSILANCQTHLVMASADSDAERFANEFGEQEKIDSTTRIKADMQEVQDIVTKTVQVLKVKKQEIKDIRVGSGQGFLHRKVIGSKPVKIQVTKKF